MPCWSDRGSYIMSSTVHQMKNTAFWEPDIFKVREIDRHLQQIRILSIARLRRDDPLGLQEVIQRKALPDDIQRMGLQDEIYRIYAARMSETEDRRSYGLCRVIHYEKLSRWAGWRLQELRDSLRGFRSEDERRLRSRRFSYLHRPYAQGFLPPRLLSKRNAVRFNRLSEIGS